MTTYSLGGKFSFFISEKTLSEEDTLRLDKNDLYRLKEILRKRLNIGTEKKISVLTMKGYLLFLRRTFVNRKVKMGSGRLLGSFIYLMTQMNMNSFFTDFRSVC